MSSMTRRAAASWSGNHKDGKGWLTTQSSVLSHTPYGFGTRFGDERGTNPEELIAAAHAGCFNMSLAFRLAAAGSPPTQLDTEAALTISLVDGKWKVTSVQLTLKAEVPGLSMSQLKELALEAKENCAVSRSLNADISLVVQQAT